MTHKQIAELANVSVSTVSKALSGSGEVSEEMRKRVIEIAMKSGYFPEKSKRKVEYSKGKSVAVAILYPEIISVAYAESINALKEELEKRGAVPSVYIYDFDREKLRHIVEAITLGGRADGIIIFLDSDFYISEQTVPTVIIGCVEEKGNFDSVYCDVYDYMYDIVAYLKSCGHKKIAFIGETLTQKKFLAYKKALEACDLSFDEENVCIVQIRFEETGYTAAKQLLAGEKLPDAAVCAYDEIALGLIKTLSENGVNVPEQLSVVGINDIPMSAYSLIPLTTVKIFEKEQAEIAVKLLYDKILGISDITTKKQVPIRHRLIKRSSVIERND